MNLKYIVSVLTGISVFCAAFGQIENYKHYFISPLKIETSLSGNFGEPRSAHFHTGLDYRTYSDGKEVVAIADGYVSRVLVSPWGYGLALYVNHPNNYTSVYAHLSEFTPEIASFVKKVQYESKSFAIDTTLPSDMFVFKRGQTMAYSGNTGFSEGPHLHFEIRETDTEYPVNPLESIYHVEDDIAPEISFLYVYPLSDISTINDKSLTQKIKIKKNSEGNYYCSENVKAGGLIGIGLSYVDRMNGTTNRYGAKSVKLFVNDELIYHSVVNKLDFEKQRCKNSMFDYNAYLKDDLHVHKLFVEPNNDAKLFQKLINDGMFYIPETTNAKIKIEIADYCENKSLVEFYVDGGKVDYNRFDIKTPKLSWDQNSFFITDECRLEIDSAVLFYDVEIDFVKIKDGKYSSVYKIGDENIAIKNDFKISFYVNEKYHQLMDKMFVVREREGKYRYIKPEFEGTYISAESSYFGQFYLWMDTIAPKITPINITSDKNMKNAKYVEFKIEDDFSGIADYDIYINEEWVLAEYEPRKNRIRYYFDEMMPTSETYSIKTVVKDNCNNIEVFETEFRY